MVAKDNIKSNNVDISIIIIHYKNIHDTLNCINSIQSNESVLCYECIVVDNNPESNDGRLIKNKFPSVNYVKMDYNSGFGRANNKGIKIAKGEYLLFFNPDIIIKNKNSIKTLYDIAKKKNTLKKHIIGAKLINKDSSFQKSIRISFPGFKELLWSNPLYIFFVQRLLKNSFKAKYEEKEYEAHKASSYAAWINAACLIVNRESIINDKLFFDKDFFLYAEDVEWCKRAQKKDYLFWYDNAVELTHLGSASMPSEFLKKAQIRLSEWLFFRKSYGFIYLSFYFFIELFTESLSDILYMLSKKAKKNKQLKNEAAFRRVYWHLMRRYALDILFLHKLSSEKDFKLNAYDDFFIQKISKGLT